MDQCPLHPSAGARDGAAEPRRCTDCQTPLDQRPKAVIVGALAVEEARHPDHPDPTALLDALWASAEGVSPGAIAREALPVYWGRARVQRHRDTRANLLARLRAEAETLSLRLADSRAASVAMSMLEERAMLRSERLAGGYDAETLQQALRGAEEAVSEAERLLETKRAAYEAGQAPMDRFAALAPEARASLGRLHQAEADLRALQGEARGENPGEAGEDLSDPAVDEMMEAATLASNALALGVPLAEGLTDLLREHLATLQALPPPPEEEGPVGEDASPGEDIVEAPTEEGAETPPAPPEDPASEEGAEPALGPPGETPPPTETTTSADDTEVAR